MRKPSGAALAAVIGALALLSACGGGGTAVSPSAGPVRVGDRAPGFTLPSAQRDRVSLGEFRGKKPVLLYFSMGPG